MTASTNIPASPACGQWETLLAEALDGLLQPADAAIFTSHKASCPACAALFEDARRGRAWLEFLAPEPEVPAGLLDRILRQTDPGHAAGHDLLLGGKAAPLPVTAIPAWQQPGFLGQVQRFAEARLMMTAAMAFFSIAMTLSLTGVRLNRLHLSDLRPGALSGTARSFLERQATVASTPLIRYYDHMRLMYEVQSTLRALRRSAESREIPQSAPEAIPGALGRTAGHRDGRGRAHPPLQAVTPGDEPAAIHSGDEDAFLALQQRTADFRGSAARMEEGSTTWTA